LDAGDLGEQLLVGDGPRVAGVALEDDGGLVALAGGDVAIDAVVTNVELAALEPLDERHAEVPFEDLVPLLVPVEGRLGALGPEAFGVVDRALVELLVFRRALHPSVLCESRRRGKELGLLASSRVRRIVRQPVHLPYSVDGIS
jgi:hypothetical protein